MSEKNCWKMDSWTIEDKKLLLLALKKYGVNDVPSVQKAIPHKSITEIRFAFDKYTQLAANKSNATPDCNTVTTTQSSGSVLEKWIDILKKSNTTNPASDVIPRVLKYIALFEQRTENTDINLTDCYLMLSQMMLGQSPSSVDAKTRLFFGQCLNRLASTVKKSDIEKHRRFIKNIKNVDEIYKTQIVKSYNRKRQIDAKLNPLNVPDVLLKKPKENDLEDDLCL